MFFAHRGKFLLSALAGTLFAGSGSITFGLESVRVVPYKLAQTKDCPFPDRASGDDAFNHNEFAVAASFYHQYRLEADRAGNTEHVGYAYEREIDSLLRAGLTDKASEALNEYKSRFPNTDPVTITIWQANIYILNHEIEKADKILAGRADKLSSNDMRRNQINELTAYIRERQKRYKEAAELYSQLAGNTGGSQSFRNTAKAALMLLASGDAGDAIATMEKVNPSTNSELIIYKTINFYLSQKKGNSTQENWKEIYDNNTVRKDGLMYMITGLIAEEFLKNEDYDRSAQAEKMAFDAAETGKDANDTLTRVIRIYQEAKNGKQAASLAEKQIGLFLAAPLPVKLHIGKLFSSNGKIKSAHTIYESMFSLPLKGTKEDLTNAFRTAFAQLVAVQDWDGAQHLAELYNKNVRKSPGFPALCKAQILEAKGLKKEAADTYCAVADEYAEFRFDASWRAMELYAGLKDYEKAGELAGFFLKNDPSSPALFYRAMAYEIGGDAKQALRDYDALTKLKIKSIPDTVKAQTYYRMGVIQAGMGDLDSAIKNFSIVLKQSPYDKSEFAPAAGYWLIHTYGVQGKDLEAEREFYFLQKQYPQSEYTYAATLWLSGNFSSTGYWDRAQKILLTITGEDAPPAFRIRAIYESALILYRQKKFADAEQKLDEIGKNNLAPDAANGAKVAFLYGDLHREQQKFDTALEDYMKSANLLPGTVLAQGATGAAADCLWAKKDYKGALDKYQELLKMVHLLTEYRAMALYKSGRCQQLMGNAKDAADLYVELLELLPPQDAQKCPVKTFWIVKGAEALISQAEEKWGDKRMERAGMALDWLQNAGILPAEIINERKKNIKTTIEDIREDIHK